MQVFIREKDFLKKSKLNLDLDKLINIYDIINNLDNTIYIQEAKIKIKKEYYNNTWMNKYDFIHVHILKNKNIEDNYKISLYKKYPLLITHGKINKEILSLINEYYDTEKEICIKLIIANNDLIKSLPPNIIEYLKDENEIKKIIIEKCGILLNYDNLIKITDIKENILKYDNENVTILYGLSEYTITGQFIPLKQNLLVLNENKYLPYILGLNEQQLLEVENKINIYKPLIIDNKTYLLISNFIPTIGNIEYGTGIYINSKEFNIHNSTDIHKIINKDNIRIGLSEGWYDDELDDPDSGNLYEYIYPDKIYN